MLGLPNASDYPSGTKSVEAAVTRAAHRARGSQAAILVEGVSDQFAVEMLAARLGRDLSGEGTVVVPMGGAHAIERLATELGPRGLGLRLSGLCDRAEVGIFEKGLLNAGVMARSERLGDVGFFTCVEDLEDELIRAAGTRRMEGLFADNDDLGRFRKLQLQPEWREAEPGAQMRRFLGSGSRRKLRYSGAVVAALPLDEVPQPLNDLLVANGISNEA